MCLFKNTWATFLFGFLRAKSRVYNWAMVGPITGPHVGSYFEAHVAQLSTQEYCLKNVFEASFFSKNLILPAERRECFKTKYRKEENGGPVIDPTKGYKWPRYKPYNIYIYILCFRQKTPAIANINRSQTMKIGVATHIVAELRRRYRNRPTTVLGTQHAK